ncbi:MAG: hypothetical protein DDT21_00864 [Syntrophomonadaceae bacterium]|nr:hypothetical protein [Bacillota bacterium]
MTRILTTNGFQLMDNASGLLLHSNHNDFTESGLLSAQKAYCKICGIMDESTSYSVLKGVSKRLFVPSGLFQNRLGRLMHYLSSSVYYTKP